jgi:hypothetical protein
MEGSVIGEDREDFQMYTKCAIYWHLYPTVCTINMPQRPPLVCKNKCYVGRLLCCTLPPFLCWGIMVSEDETGC